MKVKSTRVKIPKEYMPTWRRARAQDWTIVRTNGGHLCWVSPGGAKVYCPSTPSDHRSLENTIQKLKHKGLRV